MRKLVLIGHGESIGDLKNRFASWTDVDLTPDNDIIELNPPCGAPLVYKLDDGLRPMCHHCLGNAGVAAKGSTTVPPQRKN